MVIPILTTTSDMRIRLNIGAMVYISGAVSRSCPHLGFEKYLRYSTLPPVPDMYEVLMKKLIASAIILSFTGLVLCVALGPVIFSNNPAHAACTNMNSQGGAGNFCDSHKNIDAAVSNGGIFTLVNFALAAGVLTFVFALVLSFTPSRFQFLYRNIAGPPSTSYLLHRQTVVIRP